jgi:hypothetical protein
MQIHMAPHSGVIAHDFLDKPFPVIGWYTFETPEGGLALQPLVLVQGRVEVLADPAVQFSVVGMGELWFDLVNHHNANNRLNDPGIGKVP